MRYLSIYIIAVLVLCGCGQPTKEIEPGELKTETIELPGGVKLELVWIPPGEFSLGSQASEHGRFDEGFWMGKYEVTQEQYQAVMGGNPSSTKNMGAQKPVGGVSWRDAAEFCKKIGARLPTEAQWEYACRARTRTSYHSGDRESDLAEVGWYKENSGDRAHPVGQKKPNAWGLHDMHGNVLEWCADWYYGKFRPNQSVTDPDNPPPSSIRLFRGGSYHSSAKHCRSAYRYIRGPMVRHPNLGFRVVMLR